MRFSCYPMPTGTTGTGSGGAWLPHARFQPLRFVVIEGRIASRHNLDGYWHDQACRCIIFSQQSVDPFIIIERRIASTAGLWLLGPDRQGFFDCLTVVRGVIETLVVIEGGVAGIGCGAGTGDQEESGDTHHGYAPFCKHLFVPNFTPAASAYAAITPENRHLLRSGYEARTEEELPVLIRWFDKGTVPAPPAAKYLDVILYSREQIGKEAAAMGRVDEQTAPWGIISVKAQEVAHELPMAPITVMRNALGKAEGGSGVPLSRDAYLASIAFWESHALIK